MIADIIVFCFGAIVGSFLNVCIHRMPLGESVVWPSSHCPHCKKRIPAYDNIPFLSYLFLKGRCRFCTKHIPLRYPLVEFLAAALSVVLFRRYGLAFDFFFYLAMVFSLIVATFVDIKHRIIPDEISVGGAILGLILSAIRGVDLNPFLFDFKPLLASFIGLLAGGGVIYASGFLFDLFYFKLLKKPPIQGETESMGGGDVKLMALIGAFLGWQGALLTFFLAPFFGLIFGLYNMISKKDHTIPYGPFLSLAALVSLFWGEKVIGFIFGV